MDCDAAYHRTEGQAIDFRLRSIERRELVVELGAPPATDGLAFAPLRQRSDPEVDFSRVAVPHHLSPEILSHFPRAQDSAAMALDLGCGPGYHRTVIEHAGYTWVGLDYDNPAAQILGDAHALPFAADTFELVLSVAVLEHLQHPWVAAREAYRVLKPGGRFIGTVAFCEPFHANSHYHHSHLGILSTLRGAEFEIDAVAPQPTWPVLRAQAHMGLFPKMPERLARSIVAPVSVLHRLWWRLGALVSSDASEHVRIRNMSGAFDFLARKGAASTPLR